MKFEFLSIMIDEIGIDVHILEYIIMKFRNSNNDIHAIFHRKGFYFLSSQCSSLFVLVSVKVNDFDN